MKQFQIVLLIESSHTNLPLGILGLPCVPWAPTNEESLQENLLPKPKPHFPFSIFHFEFSLAYLRVSIAYHCVPKNETPSLEKSYPQTQTPFSIFHFPF